MKNLAGAPEPGGDETCRYELERAGIKVEVLPGGIKLPGEVRVSTYGTLHGWMFERAWTYWVAKGPGLPLEYAMPLHDEHGMRVRVAGDAGAPSPIEWYKGTPVPDYHVDTNEGLKALADAIKKSVAEAMMKYA